MFNPKKNTTFKASFYHNANPSTPPAQKTHKQAAQIFVRVQLWSIIIKCLLVGGRGASSQTAIHQHSPSRSHLTSAAIMPHQVGQLPSLAAEQRAQAGSKIKYAAAGFHSQELLGLMLY